jgi:hypothetical protein
MNITTMEQQYRFWLSQFQAGKIDPAAFAAAVDRLQFQDSQGRYWMIGAQSGAWYCYDGREWRQANPRPVQAAPPPDEPGQAQAPAAPPARAGRTILFRSTVFIALAALLLLPLLALPVGASPSSSLPVLAPSPRPPLDGGGDGGGGSGGGGSGGGGGGGVSQGAIVGTVTDLSTGLPATGVKVSVNGSIVRTDTDGAYSITGLPAGSYSISPQGVPGRSAQGPVLVDLDGRSITTIDLAFYSQPLPTDTPQPAIAAAAPPILPTAGGPAGPAPLLLMALGLSLTLAGGVMLSLVKSAR